MSSDEPEIGQEPDTVLIDYLCDDLALNSNLNKDLLQNWKLELADSSTELSVLTSLIEEEVILGNPLSHSPTRLSLNAVKYFISNLLGLDDQLYHDLKIVLLEILVNLITSSYTSKVYAFREKIHEALIDSLLQLANQNNGSDLEFDFESPTTINQHIRAIVELLELGCNTQTLQKLYIRLITTKNVYEKLIILELLNKAQAEYPFNFNFTLFNNFRAKPIAIPFNNSFSSSKCFSIHCWLRLNLVKKDVQSSPPSESNSTTVFVFTDSKDNDSTSLRIDLINDNQFMIEVKNSSTNSRMQFSFNQICNFDSMKTQGFLHLVLTYDRSCNLNLYIDGEFSESIPCPNLSKGVDSWDKAYIGSSDAIIKTKDELIISHLTVLDVALSPQWINLFYNLGLGFVWNFKDFSNENLYNLLTHLSFRGLANLSIKVKELSSRRKRGNSFRDSLGHLVHSDHTNDQLSSENRHLANGVVLKNFVDKHAIVGMLANCRIKQSNIIFDQDDNGFLHNLELPHDTQVLNHKSSPLCNAFYVLGGAPLLLELIESVIQQCKVSEEKYNHIVLQKSLQLLLVTLNDNWRLNKEFENINGYGILQIMLTNYKTINKSLKFESPIDGKAIDINRDLLTLLLNYVGYDFGNPYESIIINPSAYRFLVLSFEIFYETPSFGFLFTQLATFITESRYSEFNKMELNKMKFLRRMLHFAKSNSLTQRVISPEEVNAFRRSLRDIMNADISVETISSVSHFVIYSLYSSHNECSEVFGLAALEVLEELLCDAKTSMKVLKKFSRAITVHWILLLLSFDSEKGSINPKEVVKSGIRHLTKLLTILGPNIIKKFFQVNRGLDILTNFLKNWWADDDILCQVYLAAFGLDLSDFKGASISLVEMIPFADSPNQPNFNKLVLPEFLILLNNLVLNSVYTLSEKNGKVLSAPNSPTKDHINLNLSFDTIHLISQYAKSIEKGFNNIKVLSDFYVQKDWLDGIFELIGFLRLFLTWESSDALSSFKNCYKRLTKAVSDIFISKLFDTHKFFDIFSNLSDFTQKLVLDIVFPNIFNHINEFISVSNFIYNEKEFLVEATHLLNFYHAEYFKQNYEINETQLSSFLACVMGIVEIETNTTKSSTRQLKSSIGEVLLEKLQKASHNKVEIIGDHDSSSSIDGNGLNVPASSFSELITLLLYRQMLVFDVEVLSSEQVAHVLLYLIGAYFKLSTEDSEVSSSNFFNLLRAVQMMRQDDFNRIVEIMTTGVEYSAARKYVMEFFSILMSKNDDETLKAINKVPTYKHILNQSYYSMLSKDKSDSKFNIIDMISVTLSNGGSLGMLDNIYIKSFERDCSQLKAQLYNKELVKFNRTNQDQRETILYFTSSYALLKIEIQRLLHPERKCQSYVLDFTESYDRTRSRLVVEEQMSAGERLSYNIDIPVKQLESINDESFDTYSYAIDSSGIDTLSLSTNEAFSDIGDGYEVVEEAQETQEQETAAYEDKNRKVLRSLYLGDHIISLWNTSQINGLAPVESLLILGTTHMYFIENYFHLTNGNVVDAQDAPMESRDPYLHLINSQSSGFLNKDSNMRTHRNKSWSLDTLSSISKRQFLLRDIALEMFFTDGASIFFTCLSPKERDVIFNKLHSHCVGKGLDSDLMQTLTLSSTIPSANSSSSSFTSKLASAFSMSTPDVVLTATRKWKMGEISNFYYLMIINTLAGRTFNDLTQYPVFPWVIADYSSESLDFSNPKTFRDLSKPMGAQSEPRASNFRERYEALSSLEDDNSPAFHYGTHYSSAMITSSFMIRVKPYVQSYLLLQGGKFDHADRLFNSIEKAWISASQDNTTDVRELIPEFFYLPEFLINSNNFEFGKSQNGDIVNDVILPKWAHGDPKIFIQKNREALESPYVSANLHLWIDLIFGCKQNGPKAVEALNVFHHLSYNGAINLDNINDEVERKAAIGMINNFGQTPKQIFTRPHPPKEVLQSPSKYFTAIDSKAQPKMIFESKLRCPMKKLEISSKSGKWVGRPECVCSEDDILIRKSGNLSDESGSILINNTSFLNIHTSNITNILQIGYKMFLTASDDGLINIWRCNLKPTLSLQFNGVLRGHLSEISELKFSKSFKFGISSDVNGNVLQWDFTRFKFIRSLSSEKADQLKIDISNDTGNIAIFRRNSEVNVVQLYTINGELILQEKLPEGKITSMRFGSINDSRVNTSRNSTDNIHVYWSSEMISFAYGGKERCLKIYGVEAEKAWKLQKLSEIKISTNADIVSHELFKRSVVDTEDKIIRGYNGLIYGDTQGKVYQL